MKTFRGNADPTLLPVIGIIAIIWFLNFSFTNSLEKDEANLRQTKFKEYIEAAFDPIGEITFILDSNGNDVALFDHEVKGNFKRVIADCSITCEDNIIYFK